MLMREQRVVRVRVNDGPHRNAGLLGERLRTIGDEQIFDDLHVETTEHGL